MTRSGTPLDSAISVTLSALVFVASTVSSCAEAPSARKMVRLSSMSSSAASMTRSASCARPLSEWASCRKSSIWPRSSASAGPCRRASAGHRRCACGRSRWRRDRRRAAGPRVRPGGQPGRCPRPSCPRRRRRRSGAQSPLNGAARFSTNAATPSLWSAERPATDCSCASKSSASSSVDFVGAVERALGERQRDGCRFRQPRRQGAGFVHELVGGHDAVDQADALGGRWRRPGRR